MGDTLSVSGPHWSRRKARKIEREIQEALAQPVRSAVAMAILQEYKVPSWAKGVRVRKVGLLSWQVEATSWTGH